MRFFSPETQAPVQNSHGKRAISVRAIEVLLYTNTVVYSQITMWSEMRSLTTW